MSSEDLGGRPRLKVWTTTRDGNHTRQCGTLVPYRQTVPGLVLPLAAIGLCVASPPQMQSFPSEMDKRGRVKEREHAAQGLVHKGVLMSAWLVRGILHRQKEGRTGDGRREQVETHSGDGHSKGQELKPLTLADAFLDQIFLLVKLCIITVLTKRQLACSINANFIFYQRY